MLHPDYRCGNDLHWLLDLHWGGEVIRLSEQRLVCKGLGDDGEDLIYHDGLTFRGRLPGRISLFSKTPVNYNVAMRLALAGRVDTAAKIAAGHHPSAITAKLWYWVEGTTKRILRVNGVLDEVDYCDETVVDILEGSLKQAPWLDRSVHPVPTMKVDLVAWPNAPATVLGEYYPLPIGKPGSGAAGLYATPGIKVDRTGAGELLISGMPVVASTVDVYNVTTDVSDTYPVLHQDDGRGQRVAYVDLGAGIVAVADGDDIWVAWGDAEGGILGFDGKALRGAGDVLVWWLSRSTLLWDKGRVLATVPELNRYKIDCYFQPNPGRPMSSWDWLTEYLLPILPISTRIGPEGLFFAVWRYGVSPHDVAITFEAYANCMRSSRVAFAALDTIKNEVRVLYGPRHDNKPSAEVVVTGNAVTLRDESDIAEPDLLCEVSEGLFGRRVDNFESKVVYEGATARAIGAWKAAAAAIPPRRFSIRVRPDLAVDEGTNVGIIDPEIGIPTKRVALVEEVLDMGNVVELALLVQDRPNSLKT